jgi:hypothetical protein
MSFLFYILSYFLSDDEESSIVGTKMPRFHEYDYRDFLPTTIYWDDTCEVLNADDMNLFDESTTPPLQMYTGYVKPILKRKSSNEQSSEIIAVNA